MGMYPSCAMPHNSSPVRSLRHGRALALRRQQRVERRGPRHVHFVKSREMQDAWCARRRRHWPAPPLRGHQPLQCVMARLVEYVAELCDLAAHQRFQSAGNAADGAHRVGDVAEDELLRLVTGIHVAIQFLSVAGTGEQRRSLRADDPGSHE